MSNRSNEHDPMSAPELDNRELLADLFGDPKPAEQPTASDGDDIDWQAILDAM